MLKNNWDETYSRFDRWWSGEDRTTIIVADLRRPAPVYTDLDEYTDFQAAYSKHLDYLKSGAFEGDTVPDMSPYLGPGSLCTFIGANPIYSDHTIWFKEGCTSISEVKENCVRFMEEKGPGIHWYEWSTGAARYYKKQSNGKYLTSMPDLQQNLDIMAAVMGADRMFIEIMDNPGKVMELLELIHMVWEKAFNAHHEIISGENGYTAYTHYNIVGKGKTSVLQSDISCMMSADMFNEFEIPFLKRQCEELDNVIYHLDGPGAIRHLDSILSIDKISAVQWVPGAGMPGNADDSWNILYDKMVERGKGLYVFLWPDEIDAFLDRYGNGRILIRTLAESRDDQKRLSDKYTKI